MIFFCYGIPKSASSFVFQMTTNAVKSLEKTGDIHVRWADQIIDGCPRMSFAESILRDGLKIGEPRDDAQRSVLLDRLFDYLLENLDEKSGDAIVLKTHLPCSPHIAEAIKNGTVLASACFRHPAEMMLSRQDMAKRKGDIIPPDIKHWYFNYVKEFFSWAELPQVRKYYYDDIVLHPKAVVSDIYRHVGSTEDFSGLLDEFLGGKENRILEFNKGVLNRHIHEMSASEIAEIELFFADFMEYIKRHKVIGNLAEPV